MSFPLNTWYQIDSNSSTKMTTFITSSRRFLTVCDMGKNATLQDKEVDTLILEQQEKIILGIDPGTNFLGYGVITCKGNKMSLITLGTIDLSKCGSQAEKLKRIFDRISYLVKEYQPHQCALEAPFFGKNVQSMLKLGRAQGVAMAAALNHGLSVEEYAPKKIKMSITGNGNASKEQVAAMLQNLLNFKELPKYLDATDGLAAAVCHHFQSSSPVSAAKHKSWDAFVKANPQRVSK